MILDRPGSATQNTLQRAPEYGSDLVVDLLRGLGIAYAAFNPGASFRGLHDSLINYGGDRSPRSILCCHEEISVALAHGYAKATGRPMVAALHDVVGLQHACMAIFNAWCDRVPVLLLGGTGPMDSTRYRRAFKTAGLDWRHDARRTAGNSVSSARWTASNYLYISRISPGITPLRRVPGCGAPGRPVAEGRVDARRHRALGAPRSGECRPG